jgi:endonuclease/exonuclease/phosphatase family metal-dependent hydrolase
MLTLVTWNLYHGRDRPPDPALFTLRSRLLGRTELSGTHAQVNRSLAFEFASVLASRPWDVVLLQEAPPRWLRTLCARCGAAGASALTARNLGATARAWLAERNPDLIASGEGGSNQLLVRPPWHIVELRRFTLTRRPERRRLLLARLSAPDGAAITVANLHASERRTGRTARDVELAAKVAVEWSEGAPLVFGGDLNLRSGEDSAVFDRLERCFRLHGATRQDVLDHLLCMGVEAVEPAAALPSKAREVKGPEGRRIRLSDHAPVVASFRVR